MARQDLIEMTGKKFGRLTVHEYAGNCKWMCVCDCGKAKAIDGGMLRAALTRSCGCLLTDHCKNVLGKYNVGKPARNAKIEAGMKRFMLTAVRRVATEKWLFLCDCGNEHVMSTKRFSTKRGRPTMSCGCLRRRKGSTESSRRAGIKRRRHPILGDLTGNARVIAYANLIFRKTEKGRVCQNVSSAKRRARVAQCDLGLNSEEWAKVLRILGEVCVYCDRPCKAAQDHIIPLKDGGAHAWWNVVPACKSCNSKKGALPLATALERLGADKDRFWAKIARMEESFANVQ